MYKKAVEMVAVWEKVWAVEVWEWLWESREEERVARRESSWAEEMERMLAWGWDAQKDVAMDAALERAKGGRRECRKGGEKDGEREEVMERELAEKWGSCWVGVKAC